VTVHSGEDTRLGGVETIRAVSPDRIGHGIHIMEDMYAVELVKTRASRWKSILEQLPDQFGAAH